MTHKQSPIEIRTGRRSDGSTWLIRGTALSGSLPGPITTIVSGLYGDKPLGPVAARGVIDRLQGERILGTVQILPAVNLPAFEANQKDGPDGIVLNRSFPGDVAGSITRKIAAEVFSFLQTSTTVLDLHSGTQVTALGYCYDAGDLSLTESFGLPVILNGSFPGSLSEELSRKGISSFVAEFGGATNNDIEPGVAGCLSVLRSRGNLEGKSTRLTKPIQIKARRVFRPHTASIFRSELCPADQGRTVEAGRLAWLEDVGTGEVLEEFTTAEPSVLLAISISPLTVQAGSIPLMIGFP
jgi:predicted deacylase